MKKQVLISSLFLFLLFGCQKENIINCNRTGCLVFVGVISDLNSGAAISQASVEVVHDKSSFGSYIPETVIVGRSTTDTNGLFRISFSGENHRHGDGIFKVVASKDRYISRHLNFFSIDSTNFDIPITANISMAIGSQLDVNIKTAPDVETFGYSFIKAYDMLEHQSFSDHPNLDQTDSHMVQGDRLIKIDYYYSKFGTSYQEVNSVFIARGSKGVVDIDVN